MTTEENAVSEGELDRLAWNLPAPQRPEATPQLPASPPQPVAVERAELEVALHETVSPSSPADPPAPVRGRTSAPA